MQPIDVNPTSTSIGSFIADLIRFVACKIKYVLITMIAMVSIKIGLWYDIIIVWYDNSIIG